MFITKVLRPEMFTTPYLAQWIYEAAPDADPAGNLILWANKTPADQEAMIALAVNLLHGLIAQGILTSDLQIAKPELFNAAECAWAWSGMTALDWDAQDEAIRQGEINLMQLALDRMMLVGVLG